MPRRSLFTALFACPLAFAACSNSSNNNPPIVLIDGSAFDGTAITDLDARVASDATATDAADAGLAADAVVLTDEEIVGIVETANTVEIQEALLAVGNPDGGFDGGIDLIFEDAGVATGFDAGAARTMNASVIAFADMMISDHSQSNRAVAALGIQPQASNIQSTIQTTGQTTITQLTPLTGSAFDVAYVQSQVTAHTTLRDLITSELVPNAHNAQLAAYLQNTLLPTVQAHLTAASQLLAALIDAGLVEAGTTP